VERKAIDKGNSMIIGFSGHRPSKIGGFELPNPTYIYICQQLEKRLLELKPEKTVSGMAIGFDQYAANICIKLGIPFIASVPFLGQETRWPQKSQETYRKLLAKAAEVIIVSEGGYAAWKMQTRNQHIVDISDLLIACFDGTTGGTFNCVQYAKQQGKEVIVIDPTLAPKKIAKEESNSL
jgi:uncharacterized phage-like protein YoqJ